MLSICEVVMCPYEDETVTLTNVSSVRSCKTHRDKFQLDSPLCCSFTLVEISFPLLLQRCAYALVQVEAHKHLVILRKTSGLLCGWKCPNVSFKSYSCVGTNMAGEGPTSCKKVSGSGPTNTAGRSAAPLKHYSSVRLTDRDADSNCGCPFGSLAVCNSTSAPPPPVTQVIIQPAWAWWWWAAAGKLTGEWSPGSLTALRNHSVLSINIL